MDNSYASIMYRYIKNISPLKIKNKQDFKNYLKYLYFNKQDERLLNKNIPKIFFFDTCFSNMYHFLFESFPRLLILLSYFKEQNIKDFYIIAPPKYRRYIKYYNWFIQDIFNMLNICNNQIIFLDYKLTKANNVYISTSPRCNSLHVIPAIRKIQDYFYQKDFLNLGERIYISRKKSYRRHLVNEEEIFSILQKEYGFVRVYMEDYNLKQKINIMMNATITMSVDGTSSLNGCFMTKPNSKIIGLRLYEMNEFQIFVPSLFDNIEYLPIICQTKQKETWSTNDIYLNPDYLRKKFSEYKVSSI